MIEKINKNSVNTGSVTPSNKQPQFKGAIDGALISALQLCESQPMANVTVLDLTTAIIPRTVIEGQTNLFSGFEAFRRESSGLIVNCLIPSFIVLAFAKALESPIMGSKGLMSRCWANGDTIDKVSKYYASAEGATSKEKIEKAFKQMFSDLEGVDGDIEKGGLKQFKNLNLDEYAKKLATAICETPQDEKRGFLSRLFGKTPEEKAVEQVYSEIIAKTHISEKIRFIEFDKDGKQIEKFFSQGLNSLVVEGSKLLKNLHDKNIIKEAPTIEFAKKAKRLVTAKSVLGLGVIIPLAISMQPFNRWWTAKVAGKKGAPIYKDFEESNARELTPEQKTALFKQKIISIGSMIGVALFSIMKMPSWQMIKNIGQFSAIFPTMDQARVISTATFASRMGSSEDKNELKEATMRDIATFFTFYFIGDYVAKATATFIEWKTKGRVKLINNLTELKKGANIFQQFGHWATKTSLKSSGEVLTKDAEKMRSVCQFSNILFSLVLLGIVIPKVYRHHTDKAREKELKEQGIDPTKYYPANFAMNEAQIAAKKAQNEYFTAKNSQTA